MSSDVSGFHKLSLRKRLHVLKDFAKLTKNDIKVLTHTGALEMKVANAMIENVIGTTQMPIGVATHFKINGKDYLNPMAIEERLLLPLLHMPQNLQEGGVDSRRAAVILS